MGFDPTRKLWNGRVDDANRAGIFHPQTDADALPGIEVAGVMAFLYLERDYRVIRLSLDLDTTPEWLQRSDSTVPVRITINGVEVFADIRPEDDEFSDRRGQPRA